MEQVDSDGKTEWFGPASISRNKDLPPTAFFKQDGSLQINSNGISYDQANLYTIDGKEVLSTKSTSNVQQVELPIIRNGMYLLELKRGDSTVVIKLIK